MIVGAIVDGQFFLNFIFAGFSVLFTFASFLAGWILNNITKTIQRLDEDVRAMPSTYVTKTDYRNDIVEIKEMLARIFDKIDGKADKQ